MFLTFTAIGTFRGQTRDWTLEVRDGTLEFWDATRDEPQQWRFAVWHPLHARDVAAWTRAALEALWRGALERDNVGRRIEMSDELTAFLRPHHHEKGASYFNFRGKHHRARVRSHNYYNTGLFEHSLAYWERQLEQQTMDLIVEAEGFGIQLLSHGIYFLAWQKSGLAENDLECELQRGTLEELIRVSEWIWNLEPNWIRELDRQSPKMEGATMSLLLRSDKPARLLFMGHCKDGYTHYAEHPRAALWEKMLRFFEPRPRIELYRDEIENGARLFKRHFPLPSMDKAFEQYARGSRNFNIEPTLSFHEQFELRLPLRDWLRNRAELTDERIAELLF